MTLKRTGSMRPPTYRSALSAIHVAEDDINAAEDGDHVADLVAAQQLRQDLQIDERGGANLGAVGIFRAVADHVDALFAARALDGVVCLAARGAQSDG